MHCNFALPRGCLLGRFLHRSESDEVTFDSASADIQNQLEAAITELAELEIGLLLKPFP